MGPAVTIRNLNAVPSSLSLAGVATFVVGLVSSSLGGDWSAPSGEGKESVYAHEKWHGTVNFEATTGSRHIGQLDFMLPVQQTDDSMLFFDFRGWTDDDDISEYNLGLAYRKITGYKIIGLYGYFDRHHSDATGNQFNQFTFGAEVLKEKGEQRFNAYFPTSLEGKGTGSGNLSIVGNRLFVSGLEERAYIGFDYEAGRLIHSFGANENEVRVYGGGFFFDNDAAGYETIAGPRVRVEMRLFDVAMFGDGSRVTMSGELTWDQVRDTRAFAGIGIQIPLGKWGKHQLGGGGGKSPIYGSSSYGGLSRLERRMYDPIVRDRDVVTAKSGSELANDAENDLLFVASSEFDLDEQIGNAGTNGTVIVNGTIVTPGNHQLLFGQRLAGANSIQGITGATTGQMIVTRLPGTSGLLKSTNSSNPVVVLANSTTVDSLSINGGINGISGTNVSNITITNNTVTGAIELPFGISGDEDGSGLVIRDSFSGVIADNFFAYNQSNGISVGTNNGVISNNTTKGNGDDGIDLAGNNNGTISGNLSISDDDESIEVHGNNNGTISNNISRMSGENGIDVNGDNNGTISGNRVYMAGENGIVVGGTNFGTVSGNIVTMAADDGFDFTDNRGTITNNIANSNGEDGIDLDGDNFGTISNNTSNGNTIDGISIYENAGTITGNTSNGNGFDGIYLDGDNLAGGVISANMLSSNGSDGVDLYDNFGTITGNTATNNGESGFYIDNNNEGLISNNTATGNGDDGFTLFEDNVGTIRNNFASMNGIDGFSMENNFGLIANNTSTKNEFDGFFINDTNESTGIVRNNTATGNGEDGFDILTNDGLIDNNTSSKNVNGFALDQNNGDMTNNVASFNTAFGFGPAAVFTETQNDGTFDFNQALNNGGAGFLVDDATGTSAGNVSSGNGAADFPGINIVP